MVRGNVANKEQTGNTQHTIASYLTSYLSEAMIVTHLLFLKGYCSSWWNPHFNWHKHVDEQTKVAGFLACHMAVYYYVQHRELEYLSSNWKSHPKFALFVSQFPGNEFYTSDNLAAEFLTG